MIEFDFFDNLETTSQLELIESSSFIKIPKGTELYRQGDTCVGILFLSSGRVRVSRQHENGQSVLLYYFEQGEQCNVNFTSSYNSAPAIGTAIAETDLEGYDIPVELVSRLFIEDKTFQGYVFGQYVKRLDHMASQIEDIRFSSLDTRTLNWLQTQKNKFISITHADLADMIGTSREVVSRILKAFEKNGIVKLSRGMIELL